MNTSIDSLDPESYRKLTGGKLESALEGIGAAAAAGFEVVKLNCVLLRGINDECKSCYWMDEAVAPGAEDSLKTACRGGLRARILSNSLLRSTDRPRLSPIYDGTIATAQAL